MLIFKILQYSVSWQICIHSTWFAMLHYECVFKVPMRCIYLIWLIHVVHQYTNLVCANISQTMAQSMFLLWHVFLYLHFYFWKCKWRIIFIYARWYSVKDDFHMLHESHWYQRTARNIYNDNDHDSPCLTNDHLNYEHLIILHNDIGLDTRRWMKVKFDHNK
jgi:predicted membrane protein